MQAILEHPANAGVIRSLCGKKRSTPSVVAPDAVRDPYFRCGSHPEIVERVWEQLARDLPQASRRILCGTPVLVTHDTGLVLAICYGTSYCLRLPTGALLAAQHAGCRTFQRWSDGTVTDLSEEIGADWVFGCWAKDEPSWCRAVANGEQTA